MEQIKHTILSRCRFSDKNLMMKYLDVSKAVLVPALKSQTVQDFKWIVMCMKEDEQFIKDFLFMDFIAVYDIKQYVDFVTSHNVKIQTRHDIDDYMSPEYVEMIQAIYAEHIDEHDKFLIQAQPRKVDMKLNEETRMGRYHDERTSMFLSLCQRKCTRHIQEEKHGWMWKVAPKVYTIPEGYVKWMIHGNNISVKKGLDMYGPRHIDEHRIGEKDGPQLPK